MTFLIIAAVAFTIVSPILIHQVRAFHREWVHYHRLKGTQPEQRTDALEPLKPAAPNTDVPAYLRSDIDHALRIAQAEYNGRQFAILWRSYRRLADMFPDVMADIVEEEIAREEEREQRDTD